MGIRKLGLAFTIAILSTTISLGGCDLLGRDQEKIKRLNKLIESKDQRIENRENDIKSLNETIDLLGRDQEKIKRLNKLIESKDQRIENRENDIKSLNETILSKNETILSNNKLIKTVTEKYISLLNEYKNIVDSINDVVEEEKDKIKLQSSSFNQARTHLTPYQRLNQGLITLAQYDEIKYHERHPYGH